MSSTRRTTTADHGEQMVLPGMPGRCPYCGSHQVMPALSAHLDDSAMPGVNWECRACARIWGQMAPEPAAR